MKRTADDILERGMMVISHRDFTKENKRCEKRTINKLNRRTKICRLKKKIFGEQYFG